MLTAFIASSTLQNVLLARFETLAGNDCKYYIRIFRFLQEINDYSTTLRQVTLQTISDSECNSIYADNGGITDSMICAGVPNEDKGACAVRGS
jgi:hypothetical protein